IQSKDKFLGTFHLEMAVSSNPLELAGPGGKDEKVSLSGPSPDHAAMTTVNSHGTEEYVIRTQRWNYNEVRGCSEPDRAEPSLPPKKVGRRPGRVLFGAYFLSVGNPRSLEEVLSPGLYSGLTLDLPGLGPLRSKSDGVNRMV
ncbi:hypothetical protein STEG23_022163, partial [Scotinomys teguina]